MILPTRANGRGANLEADRPARSDARIPKDLADQATPVSRNFGMDRGTGIDRFYIERFLEGHRADVYGSVLEVADDLYTRRFGGDRVQQSDVLHLTGQPRKTTIIADLTKTGALPADAFDCVILTQTLQHVFDPRAAIRSIHTALKPGATLLLTVPGISQISRYDMDRWGDYWRFTTLSVRRLLSESFNDDRIEVAGYGNVRVASALLYGLAAEEVGEEILLSRDADYEVVITARARRARRRQR